MKFQKSFVYPSNSDNNRFGCQINETCGQITQTTCLMSEVLNQTSLTAIKTKTHFHQYVTGERIASFINLRAQLTRDRTSISFFLFSTLAQQHCKSNLQSTISLGSFVLIYKEKLNKMRAFRPYLGRKEGLFLRKKNILIFTELRF